MHAYSPWTYTLDLGLQSELGDRQRAPQAKWLKPADLACTADLQTHLPAFDYSELDVSKQQTYKLCSSAYAIFRFVARVLYQIRKK